MTNLTPTAPELHMPPSGLSETQARSKALELGRVAAQGLKFDSHGMPYLETAALEHAIADTLREVYAMGLVEATNMFVRDYIEKQGVA